MSSLTKENKEDERWYLGKGITKVVPSNGESSYLVMSVKDFPEAKLKKWLDDCERNFSGCRWAKMESDSEKAKLFELMIEGKFQIKPEKKPKTEEGIILIGGEELK